MMNSPAAADGAAQTRPTAATPQPNLNGPKIMVKVEDDAFADHGITNGNIVVVNTKTEPEHGDVVLAVEGSAGEERAVIATFEPEKNGCPEPDKVLGVAVQSLTVNELRRNNDDS